MEHNVQIYEDDNKPLLNLTKAIFWNVDFNKLKYYSDRELIIERIIEYGLQNDEIIMWQLYSYEDIKCTAINMENLEKEVIDYMSIVLGIDEKLFKSYGKLMWYKL